MYQRMLIINRGHGGTDFSFSMYWQKDLASLNAVCTADPYFVLQDTELILGTVTVLCFWTHLQRVVNAELESVETGEKLRDLSLVSYYCHPRNSHCILTMQGSIDRSMPCQLQLRQAGSSKIGSSWSMRQK